MFRRIKRQFLDLPLAQKFVGIFVVLTLLSGALMIGALHLGLSVFEESSTRSPCRSWTFLCSGWTTTFRISTP